MTYILRVSLLVAVWLLPLAMRAQQLDATDTAEIQQKALRHVRQFEGLLNVISQSDEYFRKYSFDQLIRNYYSDQSNYQIFRDSLVVIEDDLNPKVGPQSYGNLLTIKDYLQAFFSLYEKSPPPAVVFSSYEASDVKKNEFLYVEVYYESRFRNRHRAYPDIAYPVRNKRATVKAEPQMGGGWRVTITDIGYARPSDQPTAPAVASDPGATTTPVAEARPEETAEPDPTSESEPEISSSDTVEEAPEDPPRVADSEPTDTIREERQFRTAFENTRSLYRIGKTYRVPVQMNPSVPPTSLMLYRGTELVRDLSSSLSDSTLAWQVSPEVPAGDDYHLRMYDPASEGVVESPTFAIRSKPRWPWVVGGIGVAAVIYAIISSGDDGGGTVDGDDELPAPPSPE